MPAGKGKQRHRVIGVPQQTKATTATYTIKKKKKTPPEKPNEEQIPFIVVEHNFVSHKNKKDGLKVRTRDSNS